jgi:cytosine/adenosine deaminase-related metal-dependent hydrolase
MGTQTSGLVCAHHHLYSSLARGMPGPTTTPKNFTEILRDIWWKLDAALDPDIIYWSSVLGAAEALLSGTTAIIDHHESPFAIEGSLDIIADACDFVGVRHILSYGVTDRWSNSGTLESVSVSDPMTEGARRGLNENRRYALTGRPSMVGVHAAFTCSEETLESVVELSLELGVGVHIHVAEATEDADAGARLEKYAQDDWLLVHAVHLDRHLKGVIAHNPRSNMNNSVGYARPAEKASRIVLGTDGIGADMLEEFRLSFARHREHDRNATPDTSWQWLENGYHFFPEALNDVVTWSYDFVDDPWRLAYTTGIRCERVEMNGAAQVENGMPVNFDMQEVRAKASEQAVRLFARMS